MAIATSIARVNVVTAACFSHFCSPIMSVIVVVVIPMGSVIVIAVTIAFIDVIDIG